MLSLAGDFKHSLGLDINDGFLAYAKQHTPENFKDRVRTYDGRDGVTYS